MRFNYIIVALCLIMVGSAALGGNTPQASFVLQGGSLSSSGSLLNTPADSVNLAKRCTIMAGAPSILASSFYPYVVEGTSCGQQAAGASLQVSGSSKILYCFTESWQCAVSGQAGDYYSDVASAQGASASSGTAVYLQPGGPTGYIAFPANASGFTTIDNFVTYPSSKYPSVKFYATSANPCWVKRDCLEL